VGGFTGYFGVRRRWFKVVPLAVLARLLPAQNPHPDDQMPVPGVREDIRLPNGKLQRDEILKADYQENLKDARDLMELSRSFELELEKNDQYVLSLGLLKKLDEIDKVTKRIRNRMRH
jgi:hypothetical protein